MKILFVLPIFFMISCSTSGPVDTNVNDSIDIPIVETPLQFHSDLDELDQIRHSLTEMDNWASFKYQALLQREDEIISEMENVQAELVNNGGLDLVPGQSYSFKIQSFCVHPGAFRPIIGDGFRIGDLRGKAAKWLPQILEKLPMVSAGQEQVQNLIWQLLAGVHYDDLSEENKRVLGLFFNDGLVKFGSSALNQFGTDILNSVIPNNISNSIDEFNNLRDQAIKMQGDLKKLETVFTPRSNRVKPIPVGWMRMTDGYLLKVTSKGYSETRIDIYVPEDESGRKPQSKKLFKLSNLVALPAIGQRLGLSHKLNVPQRSNDDQYCKKLREFKPKNCTEMSDAIREKILHLADPNNFPKSRYQSPPDKTKPIEEETDCSKFTEEIYARAGKQYQYSNTATFQCLSVFREVSYDSGKPGDLVLYKGHIGILSKNKKVISATVGGPKRRSKLSPDAPNFLPSITELPVDQAGSGNFKILKWSCP